MKKILTAVGLAFVIAVGGAYLYFSNKEFVISITEHQIRNKVAQKLPITKTYLLLFDITLLNPRIDLENGSNRINGGMDVKIGVKFNGKNREVSGMIDISGGLKYVSGEGDFYLTDTQIETLFVQGVPEKYEQKVVETLKVFVSDYFNKNPVYSLKASDLKQAAAKMILKSIVVEDEKVVVSMGI